MKYIFVAGAPGSKWSSVCKNIYFSGDIDTSDYNTDIIHHTTYAPEESNDINFW